MFQNGINQYGSNWVNGRSAGINQVVESGTCFETRAGLSTGIQLTNGNHQVKGFSEKKHQSNFNTT